jgi:hypothetical protein
MKITWYGHSCFHLETGDSTFIEPFLEDKPTIVTLGIAWRETTGARLSARDYRRPRACGVRAGRCPSRGVRQPRSAAAALFAAFERATCPRLPCIVAEMKSHNLVVPKVGRPLTQ